MARHGADEDTIVDVQLDPALGISAHVLDHKNPKSYARDQARKAIDEVKNDDITQINREYFAALEGGKVRFFREEHNGTLAHMDRNVDGGRWSPRRS